MPSESKSGDPADEIEASHPVAGSDPSGKADRSEAERRIPAERQGEAAAVRPGGVEAERQVGHRAAEGAAGFALDGAGGHPALVNDDLRQPIAGRPAPLGVDRHVDGAGKEIGEGRRHQFGEVALARHREPVACLAGRREREGAAEARVAVGGERDRAVKRASVQPGLGDQPVAGALVAADQPDEHAVRRFLERQVDHQRRGGLGAIESRGQRSDAAVDAFGVDIRADSAGGGGAEAAGHGERRGTPDESGAEFQACHRKPLGGEREERRIAASAGAGEHRLATHRDAVRLEAVEGDRGPKGEARRRGRP